MKQKSFDLVIFDLDGTLIDPRVDITAAANYALAKLGFPEKSLEDITGYIGLGIEHLIADAFETKNKKLIDEGLSLFNRYYSKHLFDNTVLYPQVKEVLRFLSSKKKTLAILSNRPRWSTVKILKHFGIYKYFKIIIGGDDRFCRKPAACPVNGIIRLLNADKRSGIMVGDMRFDVESAKRSGIASCAVLYGIGTPASLKRSKPDYNIKNLAQLKRII